MLDKIKEISINEFLNSKLYLNYLSNNNFKYDCYFDCDGVILNTIETSFKEMGLEVSDHTKKQKNEDIITNYYKNVNWKDLIDRSGEINDSYKKILLIKNSNIFDNIAVATHRHSYLGEGEVKKKILKENLDDITVFHIPVKLEKHYALKANHSILVDDSLRKITEWVNYSGYGVLFSQKVDKLIYPTPTTPYFITSDLLDLIKIDYLLKINAFPFLNNENIKIKRK